MKRLSQIDKVILNRRGDSHFTPPKQKGGSSAARITMTFVKKKRYNKKRLAREITRAMRERYRS